MNKIPITFDERANSFDGGFTCENGSFWRKDLAPGAAWWTKGTNDKIAGLRYVCPCGCGSVGFLPVVAGYAKPTWTWDGNEALPTLTPSIQKLTPCRWHGYLTKGIFEPC